MTVAVPLTGGFDRLAGLPASGGIRLLPPLLADCVPAWLVCVVAGGCCAMITGVDFPDFHTRETATAITAASAAIAGQRHHECLVARSRPIRRFARTRASSPALGSTAANFESAASSWRSIASFFKPRQLSRSCGFMPSCRRLLSFMFLAFASSPSVPPASRAESGAPEILASALPLH